MGITSALLTIYLDPRNWKIYFGSVKELIAILLHCLLSLNNVHKNCHLLMSLSVGVLCLLARLQISLFKIILSKWEPLHNQNKINNHVGEEMSRAICPAEMPYYISQRASNGDQSSLKWPFEYPECRHPAYAFYQSNCGLISEKNYNVK